jgi:pimeloyl-ACP methyl ester carboxylesterase
LTYRHNGLALAYTVMGEGPPVVFVHGATGTGTYDWGDLAARLSFACRCVLPDLRGHGRSEFRRSGYSGKAIRSDLRKLISHLGLGRPHVVGFSYGAEAALLLELEAPGTARSLLLISPGTGRPTGYRMPSVERLHQIWPDSLRRLHSAHHGHDHWRSLVTLLQEDSAGLPEISAETLAQVRCPILLLAGDHDEPTRRRQARRFAEVNPRARYVEIMGAAHAAHLERPDNVARVIGDFLAEIDAEAGDGPASELVRDRSR